MRSTIARRPDTFDSAARASPSRSSAQRIGERSTAVTHRDGTGRVQTVTEEHNPRYYRLIRRFGELTGVPVVINTSFNVRGEPIVCTPDDAYRTFVNTGIDAVVMGNCLITEKPSPVDYEAGMRRSVAHAGMVKSPGAAYLFEPIVTAVAVHQVLLFSWSCLGKHLPLGAADERSLLCDMIRIRKITG